MASVGLFYRFIVCDKFCYDKKYRIRSHQNLVQQKAKPVISKSTNAEKPKSEFSGFDRSSRTSNITDSERFLKSILKVGLVLLKGVLGKFYRQRAETYI